MMLIPVVVAALILVPAEADPQERPGARVLAVVQATQAGQPGPSLAGIGAFVWGAFGPQAPARPRSFPELFAPKGQPPPPLFVPAPAPPPDREKTVPLPRPAAAKSKVVCGMTVIIVDGSADPKFAISPGPSRGEATIRRVPKPMCGEK